jgi:hypothetical protein
MGWLMRKPEGERESGKPVSKNKGRNQEDRHNPLEKNLQNQITIDSRTFFDSFAMVRNLSRL